MNHYKNAVLLVGSPKGENSTSASIGNYLLHKLEEMGVSAESAFVHRSVNRQEKKKELLSMVDNADLIILTFPLYVDSLPAPVIKAMELINEERALSKSPKNQGFVAISNCGFPEAFQIDIALEICRIFAKDSGFEWKGGLAFGGGGAINGIPLEERGGMVRNFRKGLDMVAEVLAKGQDIPQEAIDLISKKLMPIGLYKMMGNLGWRFQARKFDARKRMKNKPYLP